MSRNYNVGDTVEFTHEDGSKIMGKIINVNSTAREPHKTYYTVDDKDGINYFVNSNQIITPENDLLNFLSDGHPVPDGSNTVAGIDIGNRGVPNLKLHGTENSEESEKSGLIDMDIANNNSSSNSVAQEQGISSQYPNNSLNSFTSSGNSNSSSMDEESTNSGNMSNSMSNSMSSALVAQGLNSGRSSPSFTSSSESGYNTPVRPPQPLYKQITPLWTTSSTVENSLVTELNDIARRLGMNRAINSIITRSRAEAFNRNKIDPRRNITYVDPGSPFTAVCYSGKSINSDGSTKDFNDMTGLFRDSCQELGLLKGYYLHGIEDIEGIGIGGEISLSGGVDACYEMLSKIVDADFTTSTYDTMVRIFGNQSAVASSAFRAKSPGARAKSSASSAKSSAAKVSVSFPEGIRIFKDTNESLKYAVTGGRVLTREMLEAKGSLPFLMTKNIYIVINDLKGGLKNLINSRPDNEAEIDFCTKLISSLENLLELKTLQDVGQAVQGLTHFATSKEAVDFLFLSRDFLAHLFSLVFGIASFTDVTFKLNKQSIESDSSASSASIDSSDSSASSGYDSQRLIMLRGDLSALVLSDLYRHINPRTANKNSPVFSDVICKGCFEALTHGELYKDGGFNTVFFDNKEIYQGSPNCDKFSQVLNTIYVSDNRVFRSIEAGDETNDALEKKSLNDWLKVCGKKHKDFFGKGTNLGNLHMSLKAIFCMLVTSGKLTMSELGKIIQDFRGHDYEKLLQRVMMWLNLCLMRMHDWGVKNRDSIVPSHRDRSVTLKSLYDDTGTPDSGSNAIKSDLLMSWTTQLTEQQQTDLISYLVSMEDTITQRDWLIKNNTRGGKSIIDEAKEDLDKFMRPSAEKIPPEFQELADYRFDPLIHLEMPPTLKSGLNDLMCLVSSIDAHTYENSFGPDLENMFTALSFTDINGRDTTGKVWCFNGSVLTKTDERKGILENTAAVDVAVKKFKVRLEGFKHTDTNILTAVDYGSTGTDPSVISISSATATDAATLIDRRRLGVRSFFKAYMPYDGFFAGIKACRVFYHGNGTEDVYLSPYIDSFEYGADIQILLTLTARTLKFVKSDVKQVLDRLVEYIQTNIDNRTYTRIFDECLLEHTIMPEEREFLDGLIKETIEKLYRCVHELRYAIDRVPKSAGDYANNLVTACRAPLTTLVTNITNEYKSTDVVTKYPIVAILYNTIDDIFEQIYDLLDLTETPYTTSPPSNANSGVKKSNRSKRGGGLDDELDQSNAESENQGVVELFGQGNYGGYIYVMDNKQYFIMFSSQQEADDYVAAQNANYVDDFKENNQDFNAEANGSLNDFMPNPINEFKGINNNMNPIGVGGPGYGYGGYSKTRRKRNRNKNKSRKVRKTIRKNKKTSKGTNKHKKVIKHKKSRSDN